MITPVSMTFFVPALREKRGSPSVVASPESAFHPCLDFPGAFALGIHFPAPLHSRQCHCTLTIAEARSESSRSTPAPTDPP